MTVGFGSSSTAELEDHLGIPGAVPQKKVSFRKPSTRSMSVRSALSTQAHLALFMNCKKLVFVPDDISTYKQYITILNPYDFDIRYKAFCTSINRYDVSPGSGTVPALTSIDLTVRLRDPSSPGTDKFRFMISELSNRDNILGERELEVELMKKGSAPSEQSATESFRPHRASSNRRTADADENSGVEPQPSIFVMVMGLVCLLSLCLPTSGESSESWVAQHITLTINQKLIAAFVLGMVTMVVFRAR